MRFWEDRDQWENWNRSILETGRKHPENSPNNHHILIWWNEDNESMSNEDDDDVVEDDNEEGDHSQ